jgi:cytochrome c biogenesis protein CcmG, thiol:disulfide interchange protein DsbE
MKTRILIPLLLSAAAWGQQPSAREVLEKVYAAYTSFDAIHLIVERQQNVSSRGRSGSTLALCELAIKGRGRYRARLRRERDESLAVSDGEATFKALVSSRQWTRVSAASFADDADSPAIGEAGGAAPGDLYSTIQRLTVKRIAAIAHLAEEPMLVKEETLKVGSEKLPCYVIRTRTQAMQHELWVEKRRFGVVQHKQTGTTPAGLVEVVTRVRLLDWDDAVNESLFHFQPERGWTEVENLALPGEQMAMLVGERAVNFSLKTLDGEPVVLHAQRGNVVVLDFWATWCPPCRAEFPSLNKLRGEFEGSAKFYAVSHEDASVLKRFIEQHHYQMPVLVDKQAEAFRRYSIHAIPTLFIIDRDSVIRYHFVGDEKESTLRQAIRSVIDAAPRSN